MKECARREDQLRCLLHAKRHSNRPGARYKQSVRTKFKHYFFSSFTQKTHETYKHVLESMNVGMWFYVVEEIEKPWISPTSD